MAGLDFDCNELNSLVNVSNACINGWVQELDDLSTKMQILVNSEAISGKTADSIRTYLYEVHISSLLPVIKTLLCTYEMYLALYNYHYSEIDSDLKKHLNEETMTAAIEYYDSDLVSDFSDQVSELLSSISELVTIDNPSVESILQAQSRMKFRIKQTLHQACELEQSTKNIEIYNLNVLVEAASQAVLSMISRPATTVTEYKSGQIRQFESVGLACTFTQLAEALLKQNNIEISNAIEFEKDAVKQQLKWVEEQKERNKDAGRAEVIGGVVTFAAGVFAIVATWELSVPVMIIGSVTGSSSCIFGLSNIYEGGEKWYTGNEDALNPIRDYVFRGNDKLYQLWGNANVFVASMVTPIGMSTKAGQAVTIKTYVNITGQYLTGAITSYGVNYFGEKMGLSNTQTTLLNIGTGYLQGLAWNKANNVISKIQLRSRSINEHVNINPENVGEGGLNSVDDIIRDGSQLENGKLKPNVKYQTGEHEYIYQTNEDGLITNASTDNLQIKTHEGRLNHNPNTYGKETGDHAGHIFGDRFGGSPELDNLVSQAKQVNLSEFKVVENEWAKALENGKKVTVDIDINYSSLSGRPTSFDVSYTIDDIPFFKQIKN